MSDEQPADALPTLAYATTDTDGLPSIVPEAERMIDEGATPYHLRELFRKARPAALYYAKSMARRYGAWAAGDVCQVCGTSPAGHLARTVWTVDVPTRAFELQLSGDSGIPCVLYFPLCSACADAWSRRIDRFDWLQRANAWRRYAGYVLWVPILVCPRVSGRWTNWGTPIVFGTWFLAIFLLAAANAIARRYVTPKAIREPTNRRFKFTGLDEIIDRKDVARVADDVTDP